ncbi:MAG TPA: hypothetical protein DDZ43_04250, partial [Hyphomonadaceae bacterium]|nr:hypothetical protein [Hyphomonadaceae bacterium]
GGVSKALIEYDGEPLWRRIQRELSAIADEIVIVSPKQPDWLEQDGDIIWLADHLIDGEMIGPAGALSAALAYAHERYGEDSVIVTAPVDAPLYKSTLSEALLVELMASSGQVILAETGDRLQPAFGAWRAGLATDVNTLIGSGERALHRIASHIGAARVSFAADDLRFFNINRPEDLERAQRLGP